MLTKIRTTSVMQLLLSGMALFPVLVSASIKIVDSGRSIPSRPDRQLGQQLWKGYEYMGRLQFLHGNLQLCPSSDDPHRRYSITAPADGLPVALFAKAGGCTIKEKAMFVSTMIDPPNTVGYLIVEDSHPSENDSSISNEFQIGGSSTQEVDKDTAEKDIVDNPFPTEAMDEGLREAVFGDESWWGELQHSFEFMDDILNDAEKKMSESLPKDDAVFPIRLDKFNVKSKDYFWWGVASRDNNHENGDEHENSHRILKLDDNISVAILHVGNRAGFEILDLMLKESADIQKLGGTKVLLNSERPTSAKAIVIWIFFSLTIGSFCCCCAMFCAGTLAEEETNAPRQPVRRRLTHNQVRDKFPAFHYHPENHVEQPLDDECAICLDDFAEGTRLRQLPCGHTFHSSCIARWMIERAAVCPLCKADFYEEEVEDSESEESVEVAEPTSVGSLLAWLVERSGSESAMPGTQPLTSNPNNSIVTNPASSRSSWWRWGQSTSTTGADETGNEGATPSPTPPTPPPARAFTWMFGRQRRRGAESGMLTELTEPLISAGTNEAISEEITASANETSSEDPEAGHSEEVATSREEAQPDPSARPDPSAQSGSGPVEV